MFHIHVRSVQLQFEVQLVQCKHRLHREDFCTSYDLSWINFPYLADDIYLVLFPGDKLTRAEYSTTPANYLLLALRARVHTRKDTPKA